MSSWSQYPTGKTSVQCQSWSRSQSKDAGGAGGRAVALGDLFWRGNRPATRRAVLLLSDPAPGTVTIDQEDYALVSERLQREGDTALFTVQFLHDFFGDIPPGPAASPADLQFPRSRVVRLVA